MRTNDILVVPCTDVMGNNANFDLSCALMMEANESLFAPCSYMIVLMTHLVVSCTDMMDINGIFICSLH